MIRAYLAERFPIRIFAPALAALSLAAWSTARQPGVSAFAYAALLMTLLVAQFRLWDDLEDRERDRGRHPARILVRAGTRPFVALCVLLGVAAAAVTAPTPRALVMTAALDGAAFAAYRRLRPRLTDSTWRFGVLPLKYPAFIVIAAAALDGASAARLMPLALAAYLAACAHEAWHDRPSRAGAAS